MMTIITALLPMLLKLLGMYFSSKAASAEQREAYKEFITKIQGSTETSAKLKLSYDEQLKRLEEMEKQE